MHCACVAFYCHLKSIRLYHAFLRDLINGMFFGKKKLLNIKACFDFLYKFCLKQFSLQKEFSEISYMYVDVHAKCQLFCSLFKETWILWQIFVKYSNTQFHENPSSGSRVVPCGQTDRWTDGQADS